jgi:DNA polymerase-3 subunit delta'
MILPWLEATWSRMANSLAQGRMPHAIMLSGPAGIGKVRLAEQMVSALLCRDPRPQACGECRSCRLLAGGAHPDRFILVPAEDERVIRVEQVRDLISRLVLTTTISPRKVALIMPAEAMTGNAANALLKTLEEPPGESVLVLVGDDPSRLPVTIRSRCQMWTAAAPPLATAAAWLEAEEELSAGQARLALEATGGSPLQAARLAAEGQLEQYIRIRNILQEMIGKPSRVAAAAAALADLDPNLAWRWLSLAAATAVRSTLGAAEAHWPDTNYELPAGKLARLQSKADWAHNQLGRGLRQDLLLQEWLLEWSRLPSTEPIR